MAGSMRCYQINAFGQDLVETALDRPRLTGSEVLVRVRGAGVCHSDVHICEGHYDLGGGRTLSFADRIRFPRTLGHEVAGELIELGPDAEGVEIGANYLICSWIGCRACDQCLEGLENLCVNPGFIGVNRDGGFADVVVVPHPRYLVPLGGLDPVVAAPMVCSGLTTYSAIKKFGPLDARRPLVIIGAGGLGLIAIEIARMLGSSGVVIVEKNEARRAAALTAGALAAIDPGGETAVDAIRQAVGGPVWGVLDLVGTGETAQLAVEALAKTGKLVIVGLFGGALTVPVPTFPLKVLTIQGSYTGSPAELVELVELAQRLGVPSAPVDIRPLSSAASAIADLRDGLVTGRIVLAPDEA
jgi:propanol-preferring alcohol dehydrogenase